MSRATVNSIEVNTPMGVLKAVISPDTEYPGIYISLDGKEFVLVEYERLKKEVRTVIWRDGDFNGNPMDVIPHRKEV
jgi:hypothetical protein